MKTTIKLPRKGDKVKWKAAGKCARAYGVAGKILSSTVTKVTKDGVYVKPVYGPFSGHIIPLSEVQT